MADISSMRPVHTSMICPVIVPGWQTMMYLRTEYGPIADSAKMRRTVNGTAVNLARPAFRLYRYVLTCDGDQLPPSLAHMWPGTRFTLIPAEDMSEPTTAAQQRPAHPGTTYVLDQHSQPAASGRRFYRPVLDLVVWEPWVIRSDENGKTVGFTLVAEEYKLPAED